MAREFTSMDLLTLNAANKTLEKQGFNPITFTERLSGMDGYTNFYECFCTYGQSGETYNVTVDPFAESILTVHKI